MSDDTPNADRDTDDTTAETFEGGSLGPAEPADDRDDDAPVWDAVAVMRARAAATRTRRDAGIGELRREMGDDAILAEFGLNLPALED